MSVDLSGYTFTNGTKVTDWLASLPSDDRTRAAKVVEDFVTERKPLNMLQVKIRLAAPPADSNPETDEKMPETETISAKESLPPHVDDAYNSPGPIRPTVDTIEHASPPRNKRKHTLIKFFLIFAAIFFALAIFTNPSRQTHVRTLTESVARATAGYIGQDAGMDMFGDMFGFVQPRFTDDMIESLAYDVLNEQLEYHDYIIFSTCSAAVGYDKQTVSIGAFGMVRATEDNLTIN